VSTLRGVQGRLKRYSRLSGEPIVRPPECLHPEDKRLDASTMGRRDRWICRVCGYANWQPGSPAGQEEE